MIPTQHHSTPSRKTFLDDKGVFTVQTVIVTSVLVLIAVIIGVVIFNISTKPVGPPDPNIALGRLTDKFGGSIEILTREEIEVMSDDQFENDETSDGNERRIRDGISDVLYLAENVCPSYEVRHWGVTIEEVANKQVELNDLVDASIRKLFPTPIVQTHLFLEDQTFMPRIRIPIILSNNWIAEDNLNAILSPVLKSDRCSYLATDDYDIALASFPGSDTETIHNSDTALDELNSYSSNRKPFTFSNQTPMRYKDCRRSGLAPASSSLEETCELHFNVSTIPSKYTTQTDTTNDYLIQKITSVVGGNTTGSSQIWQPTPLSFVTSFQAKFSRASWHLMSYCAMYGGYIPLQNIIVDTIESEFTLHFNKCVVSPEDFKRTCSLPSLGLEDPITVMPIYGFSISGDNSKCEITEAAHREVGKVSLDSVDTRTAYTKLPIPITPNSCPNWLMGTLNITGTRTGNECIYSTTFANLPYCNELGLKLKLDRVSCSYTVSDSSPECPTKFRVSLETGRASCVEPLGNVPKQWESVCLGWKNTQSTIYDHDGDDLDNNNFKDDANDDGKRDNPQTEPATPKIADDQSSVYAYYSQSTDTYRCSFKNTYTNGARECLGFGYQPGKVGECEVVGRRTYNPRTYPPTCAVMRATPYHTSQEQLFSIAGLELAFRNRAARRGTPPADTLAMPGFSFETSHDDALLETDFAQDINRIVAPNINNQLDYYYKRIIKPALESYLPSTTASPRYNELWLPSQFPTGNVSLSRTFSQENYPSKYSKPDPTENNLIDFLYNRRSPDSLTNNCDNYKQFYHPLHIEKSSSDTQTYKVGYNDQDKSVVCSGTDSNNFWEPRYYLDVITSGTTYSGSYCDSSTIACTTQPTGAKLYRECGLVGTDTAFTRPAEISDSDFTYNNTITHPMNSYIKECADIGYSGGTTELFDYKVFEDVLEADRLRIGVVPPREYTHFPTNLNYTVSLSTYKSNTLTAVNYFRGNQFVPYIVTNKYWVSPINNIIGNYSNSTIINGVSLTIRNFNYIKRHDNLWFRSDLRTSIYVNVLDTTDTYLFWLLTDDGLKWTQYGITEMLKYINDQTINSTGTDTDLHRSAELKFSNSNNFNERTRDIIGSRGHFDPLPGNRRDGIGYFNTHEDGFAASRGGTSSNLTFYAKYSEQNCKFKVPESATDDVKAFFRACQSLSTYFPTRFSYHKPIEVRDFATADITFPPDGTLPTQDDFGHWRQALIDDTAKHPSLIKYGDTAYKPPTYFHINTNKDNGYFYCEANPTRGTQAGVVPATATRTSATTFTVSNSACASLNQALGITTAANTIDFEDVTEGTMTQLNTDAKASAIGFIGHKEGPYDYYHCKWRAPFKGNPLAG